MYKRQEYIYFQPKGTEPIYAELTGYEVLENTARFAKILLKHELTIPVSADEKLDAEQRGIIEFMTVSYTHLDVYKRQMLSDKSQRCHSDQAFRHS